MSSEVRAIRIKGQNVTELTRMPVPKLGEGEMLVEMKACGLCGSDLEKIKGEYVAAGSIIGHEACGLVAEVSGESLFKVGDRVFPHHHVPCYECDYCRKGSETMCPHYRRVHLDPCGFSDYFRVDNWIIRHGGVLRLPDHVSFEEGSFIEPVGCCIRGLKRVGVREGDTVLLAGAGPIGLLCLQLLKLYGCSRIFVSETSPYRLDWAEKMGAELTINPVRSNVHSEVKKAVNGVGVDLAVVASGSPKAVAQALLSVRRGGRVCLIGVSQKGSSLDYDLSRFVTEEVSMTSSYGAIEADTKMALQLIASRRIDVKSLATHRFSLEEFDEAVRVASEASAMKCLITP